MRFHLLFSLPINLGPPKKIMEIRGGVGGGASLGLEIQAGGGVQLTRKCGQERGKKKSCPPEGCGFFLELTILHRLHEIW